MVESRVVAHFKDKTLMKGVVCDFSPAKEHFHITCRDGGGGKVSVNDLKGLFFVKDFTGDSKYRDAYKDYGFPGHKVKVNFLDGEEIVGFTEEYRPDWPGFFVVPADRKSNNERIFVVVAACSQVGFMI